jgi:membrane protease YdiL (CAAX protease family)
MIQNLPNNQNPILFFVSRLFILGGMVLVFSFTFLGLGMFISRFLFGVDLFSNPHLMNEMRTNIQVLRTMQLSQSLSAFGGFLLPALYFPRSFGMPAVSFLKANYVGNIFSWFWVPVLYLIATPFIGWTVELNEEFQLPESWSILEAKLRAAENAALELTKAFISNENGSSIAITILVTAIIPAIAEEFLFRGALLQLMFYCFKNRHISIWIGAILFSAFHGQFYGFLPRMLLGVCLGYLVMAFGSIWPAVLFHLLNNALVTLNVFYKWDEIGPDIFHSNFVFPWYINAISFMLLAAALYQLTCIWKKRVYPNGE